MSRQSAGNPKIKILQETESIDLYNAFFPEVSPADHYQRQQMA